MIEFLLISQNLIFYIIFLINFNIDIKKTFASRFYQSSSKYFRTWQLQYKYSNESRSTKRP